LKLFIGVYMAFCLFSIIWLRAAIVDLEYELGELDTKRVALLRERKIVVARRSNFYSSEKIEKVAMKRLGMALPERGNIYYVNATPGASTYRTSMK
ncbi:MAG: hypothetical protein JSV11_11400, partial [Nitrospiraceae bacterium]